VFADPAELADAGFAGCVFVVRVGAQSGVSTREAPRLLVQMGEMIGRKPTGSAER
jgi:hypothetical protein